jgi:hypothetical protein
MSNRLPSLDFAMPHKLPLNEALAQANLFARHFAQVTGTEPIKIGQEELKWFQRPISKETKILFAALLETYRPIHAI